MLHVSVEHVLMICVHDPAGRTLTSGGRAHGPQSRSLARAPSMTTLSTSKQTSSRPGRILSRTLTMTLACPCLACLYQQLRPPRSGSSWTSWLASKSQSCLLEELVLVSASALIVTSWSCVACLLPCLNGLAPGNVPPWYTAHGHAAAH